MGIVQLTIPQVSINETEMQRAFYGSFSTRYELVANNLYLGWCGGEMDIFGLRKSGFIDEIEIKRSVSDFRADFKKTIILREECEAHFPGGMTTRPVDVPKHDSLESGRHSCNYFSFYLPADIVDKCEIPDYAGLYVFAPDNYWCIREVKKAPRLHTRKISDHNKYHTAKKMHYRYWDMVMAAGRK